LQWYSGGGRAQGGRAIILLILLTAIVFNKNNFEYLSHNYKKKPTKFRIYKISYCNPPLPPPPIQDIVESLPPPLVNIPGLHHWLIVFYPGIISKR
jgi:hypothetical protein